MSTGYSSYLDFQLNMIEKTYELYVKRLDVWEDQFYKIKYGCVGLVVGLIWFRYSFAPDDAFLSALALAATLGFWVFEESLRTTMFRYLARLDLLTDMINDEKLMQSAFDEGALSGPYILDFDVRTSRLEDSVDRLIAAQFPDDQQKRETKAAPAKAQKEHITRVWTSMKLKNNVAFYGALIVLQLAALVLLSV